VAFIAPADISIGIKLRGEFASSVVSNFGTLILEYYRWYRYSNSYVSLAVSGMCLKFAVLGYKLNWSYRKAP